MASSPVNQSDFFDVQSVEGIAPDGTVLAGTLTRAKSAKPTAFFITHGTAGAHNRRVAAWLGPMAARFGYSTLALDRRDHDSSGGPITFEDGLEDLRVGLDLLERAGYSRVYVCGHSKGTIYPLEYVVQTWDRRVVAVGLLGAVHDNELAARDSVMAGTYDANVARARELIAAGRGDEIVDFASPLGFPVALTPKAMLSLFGPETRARPIVSITQAGVPVVSCVSTTDGLTPPRYHDAIVAAARAANVPIEHIVIEDVDPKRDPSDGHAFFGMEEVTMRALVDAFERLCPGG